MSYSNIKEAREMMWDEVEKVRKEVQKIIDDHSIDDDCPQEIKDHAENLRQADMKRSHNDVTTELQFVKSRLVD